VRNLRVDEERGALVGDLEDVPTELASIIPTAFRRRSVEIGWNVRTPAGRRYRAALTGLALLGVQAPAVKGLADVLARYSAADPHRGERRTLDGDELYLADDGETAAQALATARAALAALPPVTDVLDALDPSQEVPNVPITDERLRELLGVEADADLEATITGLRTRAETNPGDPGDGNGNGEPAEPAPGSPGTPEPGTPGSPDGGGSEGEGGSGGSPTPPAPTAVDPRAGELVTVSAAALSALQANAAAGAEARTILRTQEVEAELASALSAGRIAPADVEHWRGQLSTSFDGTRTLLSKLTPVFPTSELGSDAGDGTTSDAAFDSFLADVFGVTK
jgi:hypothetical protein